MSRSKLRALASFRLRAHGLRWKHSNGGVFKRSPLPYLVTSGCVGDEMHMVTQCDGYTAVRQRHPHLFDELGGWQQVTCQLVSSQQFCQFMHHDPFKVAWFVFECSQRRWENPPDELLFAD